MRKHVTLLVPVLSMVVLSVSAQNYKTDFYNAMHTKDTAAARKVLVGWELSKPQDAEMFVSYFNFYFQKAKKELITLSKEQLSDSSLVLYDSTKQQAGFIGSTVQYDLKELNKGIAYIDRGLALYPDRLDMRFGKCYVLGESRQYEAMAQNVVATIDYVNKVKFAVNWSDGKPLNDPKQFFYSSLQDYVMTIYNANDDSLLHLMRDIGEAVLKYEPGHTESLTNIGLSYVVVGNYDQGLIYLLKAEAVASKDPIVLLNIAEAYKRKGDKAFATKYYQKVIALGDSNYADDAKKGIDSLK